MLASSTSNTATRRRHEQHEALKSLHPDTANKLQQQIAEKQK